MLLTDKLTLQAMHRRRTNKNSLIAYNISLLSIEKYIFWLAEKLSPHRDLRRETCQHVAVKV